MPQVRTCEYFEKKLLFLNIKSATVSGPVELCEKMVEYIKNATGPDLWIFWEKAFFFKHQKCHKVRTCGITWKNARIYKMYHRSGRTCDKFWEKTFIFKYQKFDQVRTCGITWKNARIYKMCHRSGPVNILRKNFYFQISKVRQVRTCGITWKNARIYKTCQRSGPVNILRKIF